jgi:RNA polymerase sigma factor (sigma-70 family)
MARVASGPVIRQLETLFEGGSAAGLSDRQLLERYTALGRDPSGEAAFSTLVARHGPMVLGVCRQILGDVQHAEDAFQAVFLVLAQKARSIRDPDLLGNWLYGVAVRTARCARQQIVRRRRREEHDTMTMTGPRASSRVSAEPTAPPADWAPVDCEQADALHGAVDHLPRAFRLPVVLCYFEGLTLDEAARRLRCPPGTLRSRLARAREKLRTGLARRGVVVPAAALATALAPRPASASISPLLCDSTTRAAIQFAARHAATSGALSASAAALAQEVLDMVLIHKLRVATKVLLALAAFATGAGVLAHSLAMKEKPMKEPAARVTKTLARGTDRPVPEAKSDPATAGRMTVTGRVLGTDGKPAVGAPVDIVGQLRAPEAGTDVERAGFVILGQGTADGDGRLRIEAGRSSSDRFTDLYALAGAARLGSAFGCVELHPDAEQPVAEIHLQPEQVIHGKLVDVNSQPAAGIEVQLHDVYGNSSQLGGGRFDSPGLSRGYVSTAAPKGLHAWPKGVTTDAQGRFTFTGVPRDLHVSLSVGDPRFAQQRFDFDPKDRDAAKEVALALQPATMIEGRVLAADSGQAIPKAVISVRASMGLGGGMVTTKFRADDQGRFQVNPYAGSYFRMRAFPPEGQPYLPLETEFEWTKGAVKKEINLTLPRGVLLRGRVTERRTGRPVAAASVQFFPTKNTRDVIFGFEAIVRSRDDGSFQVSVPAGKGYLMVTGPTLNYVPQEIGGGKLFASGERGGHRFYAHAISAYEVAAGHGAHELNAVLQPGKALKGHVVGPAGETAGDTVILTRQQLDPINCTWKPYNFSHTHDGRFELPGFDPEKAVPAYFLDTDHEWGTVVELSGKQAGEELAVRLQPCGQARARFVGPDGKPIAKFIVWPYIYIMMTPGMVRGKRVDAGSELAADEAFLPNVDRKHHPTGLATDAEGRVTLPDLIPGAPYRISDWSTVNVAGKDIQLRKDFTVKAGETLELGDILVEGPRSQ